MEIRSHCDDKHPPPLAPPRRAARGDRKHAGKGASFSASLLDAIYQSFDEGGAAAAAPDVVVAATARRFEEEEEEEKAAAPPQFWWAKEAVKPKQAAGTGRRRRESTAVARPRHSGYASSTASSSDSSTCSYGFSCSSASTTDAESTRCRRSPPPPPPPPRQPEEVVARLAPDGAEGATPPNIKTKKKSRPCFPGARLRPRDAAPSSPGQQPPSPGTFACVLKALLTSARLPRKPRIPTAVPSPRSLAASPQPSRTTSASATSTAKTTERRSVRFCSEAEASVVRRRVEELVRSLGELEEDDEQSDSSSDLFELESISGANGDELPVYGTTSVVTNRAIAHRAVA